LRALPRRSRDALERSGPVAAAVRAAGYTSEEAEEGTDEGSSVEEEQHAHAAEEEGVLPPVAYRDMHGGDGEDTEPPSYRRHPHELPQPGCIMHLLQAERQYYKKLHGTQSPDDASANVPRRPSLQQQ
jgi:hypothetical protein